MNLTDEAQLGGIIEVTTEGLVQLQDQGRGATEEEGEGQGATPGPEADPGAGGQSPEASPDPGAGAVPSPDPEKGAGAEAAVEARVPENHQRAEVAAKALTETEAVLCHLLMGQIHLRTEFCAFFLLFVLYRCS